jgi:membrane fusion protein (multidrug efflux system)
MWVNFAISEYKFLELQKRLKHAADERPGGGLPFRLRLADGTDYPLVGALDFMDAAIDQKSGTLQARISVRNPERLLRPGLFARVIVPDFESRSAIRIPQAAVQELQGLKSVYVVAAGDKVESRQITANYRVGGDWVVDRGLQPGDRVVVEGTDKLKPGVPVQPLIVGSAANSNAGAVPNAASR